MADEVAAAPAGQVSRAPRFGLSARLLLLTALFVMIAQVVIYLPSLASFRRTWLSDRLAAAQVAALVLDATTEETLPEALEARLLAGVGARAIAVKGGGTRRLLAADDAPKEVARVADLREASWVVLMRDAVATLAGPSDRPLRVVGHSMGVEFVEIVIDEGPLRAAMLHFSRNLLLVSLLISLIAAGLVYFALHRVIVRPVRRLVTNIALFADGPEDASRIIRPTTRSDEIGEAERALAGMERSLADELRQKRRLADLGLAMSKVNHELRNMLATAQLLADRIERTTDPLVQRVAPRLMTTLDRAIAYCEATLAYGRAAEPPPQRRAFHLRPLVEEMADLTGLAPEGAAIALDLQISHDLVVRADADQIGRVLVNLLRNAVQALSQAGTAGEAPRIAVRAARDRDGVTIWVSDNGPGLPERARQSLFAAFKGGVRPGGTGLGLAVSAEIVRQHGGSLAHDETHRPGACFRITLPDGEEAPSGARRFP